MLFTTAAQWLVLAIIFVGGWLLGLASHPGGKRWRERYATEREAHAATRRDYDARLAEANARANAAKTAEDPRLAAANQRIADLERENARLTEAAPVAAATIAPTTAARPADLRPTTPARGWFDWR